MEPDATFLFRCTLCGQSFKQKADLAEHMLVHLGQKKHACHLCGKKFFNEKSLDLHIKIHATEIKYEAMSTPSEENLLLSDQVSSIAGNPQVKVRVKSFPANANAKRAKIVSPHSDNVMHFQLNEEEFHVIEESEVYTSQGETHEQIFEEKTPVQLKVWSNSQRYEHTSGAADNAVSQSPYVIKVQNKTIETPKVVDSSLLKMNVSKTQTQEPIRIFVGSNIRLEGIGDLQQQFTPQISNLRNEDVSQRMKNDSVYFYNTNEDTLHHTGYHHRLLEEEEEEESDDELNRLEEEMVDGDLQPLPEEMDELHTLQDETNDMHSYQEDISEDFQVTERRVGVEGADKKSPQITQETVNKSPTGQFYCDFRTSQEQFTKEAPIISKKESLMAEGSALLRELSESLQGTASKRIVGKIHALKSDETTSDEYLMEKGDCDAVQLQQEGASKLISRVNASDACAGHLKLSNERVDPSEPLKEHVMRSSEKPHKCHICGLGFRFSFYLKAHLPVHSKEKAQYECEICNRSFKYLEIYNDHLRLHENQKMPCCYICLKEHKNPDEAKTCVDAHIREKHVCPVCQCKFETSIKLKSHMKTHTEHKCYICDKIFKDHSKLNRHMESHRNKKLYHCKVCNRTIYCLPSEVQRHKALHKNIVTCPVCSMEFANQQPLLNHMKRNHWRSKVSSYSKSSYENVSELEVDCEDKDLHDVSGDDEGDKDGDKDVRRKVASLLIEELLKDMFEEEFDESFDGDCEPLSWLEKISEGLTKEQFMECIGKCQTKHDVVREVSFYIENDIIKDAVSDCMLKERICLQKIAQMMKASEQLLGKAVIVRKNVQGK